MSKTKDLEGRLKAFCGAFPVLLLITSQALASGTIEGRVIVFPFIDITVTLTNKADSTEQKAIVNYQGAYSFSDVPSGWYRFHFHGPFILPHVKKELVFVPENGIALTPITLKTIGSATIAFILTTLMIYPDDFFYAKEKGHISIDLLNRSLECMNKPKQTIPEFSLSDETQLANHSVKVARKMGLPQNLGLPKQYLEHRGQSLEQFIIGIGKLNASVARGVAETDPVSLNKDLKIFINGTISDFKENEDWEAVREFQGVLDMFERKYEWAEARTVIFILIFGVFEAVFSEVC